jgi:cyanophycinase-like exopeptidase
MGGGIKAPEALAWFAERAGGGDVVVLNVKDHEDELTNPDSTTNALWRTDQWKSLTTLIVDSRDKANDPYVEAVLRRASGVFLPGGDQTAYYDRWASTRLAEVINERAALRNIALGGSSAGMHSLGWLIHTPEGTGSVTSEEALHDPYLPPSPVLDRGGVTIREQFLAVPFMENTITDTHWSERDRLGRSIVFLARIIQDGVRAVDACRLIACDEGTAFCLGEDGKGTVMTAEANHSGGAFFIRPNGRPNLCRSGEPLTWQEPGGALTILRAGGSPSVRSTFDLVAWEGQGLEAFRVNVEGGRIIRLNGA